MQGIVPRDKRDAEFMQAVKLALTLAGMVAPNVVLMRAMGWTDALHFALLGSWALVSTALIVLIPERHRRPELKPRIAVSALAGCVTLGALVLATEWDVRLVVAALLVLPGVSYLLLEALGLTPRPVVSDSPLP